MYSAQLISRNNFEVACQLQCANSSIGCMHWAFDCTAALSARRSQHYALCRMGSTFPDAKQILQRGVGKNGHVDGVFLHDSRICKCTVLSSWHCPFKILDCTVPASYNGRPKPGHMTKASAGCFFLVLLLCKR